MTALEEQRLLVGVLVLIGDLSKIHIVTADIADGTLEDHLVPAGVDADDVSAVAGVGLRNRTVARAGAAADIDPVAGDPAIAKLHIFTAGGAQVVFVHEADLQIVVDLVPVADPLQEYHHFVLACVVQCGGVCAGAASQPQGGSGDECHAQRFLPAGCRIGGDAGCADKKKNCQHKADNTRKKFHTMPSVLLGK